MSVTTAPAAGAEPLRKTVPVVEFPPTTEVGDKETPLTLATVKLKVAVLLEVALDAVIVAVSELATPLVVIVNVCDVDPAAAVMVDGTVALELLEANVIELPPVGTGPPKFTVPIALLPPTTVVGLIVTDVIVTTFSIFAMKPVQMTGPHPDAKSQPTCGVAATEFGRGPILVPVVMSKKIEESPL